MKPTLAIIAASVLVAASATHAAPPLAEPAPATTGPVDGLVSAPDNFKLLLENDRVRVLQYTLLPGALDHRHTHPPRVGYVLSGAKVRVTEADGSHEDYDEKTGEIYWGEFSPLHDTLNLDTKPYIALLVEVKDAASTTPSADEAAIRAARDSFNAAIERGDVPAIASALADNAQMVTGNDSVLYAGKPAQVAIWAQDLKDPSRGIYVRTPDRIEVSPLAPMALETGHWKGVDSKSASDWASGVYSAKWRRTGGKWLIESETFMTTACAGKYCPTKRWERASASTKPFLLGFRLLHAGRCDSSAPLRPRRHPLARAALLRFSVPVAPRIPSRKVTK